MTPKSPALIALWLIPFASLTACLFLVNAVNEERRNFRPDIDAILALGAWADMFMILGIVSLVGALVLSGVLHAVPVVAETYGLKHRNETSKASGSEGE